MPNLLKTFCNLSKTISFIKAITFKKLKIAKGGRQMIFKIIFGISLWWFINHSCVKESHQVANKLWTLFPQHFDTSEDINHMFTAESFPLDSQC
jgi:hypothetical protein